MKTIARYENPKAEHSYEIEVAKGESVMVDANNRSQAAKIARENGHKVCSVNMIG